MSTPPAVPVTSPEAERPAPRPLARIGLVLAFAVLVCARVPGALQHGRLWAEEGRVFYERAATMPWHSALLAPFGGYLNLVANAAPIVARRLVHLEWVPWVTALTGLVFQCCPAILLVCSRDAWLRRPLVLIAALLLIVTAPMTEEVYLETLHSQFHLALCCALILALDVPRWRLGLFGGALLLLAPLCGPAACLLLPFFGLRAIVERSRGRALQCLALGVSSLAQFLLFYSHEGSRTGGVGPILLMCIVFLKQIVVPCFGRQAGQIASDLMRAQIAARLFPWQPVLAVSVGFCAFAILLVRSRLPAAILMGTVAVVITPIAYWGALVGGQLLLINGNGTRYAFLPEVLCALALLGVAAGRARPERWVARGGVIWLLLIGITDVPAPSTFIKEGPNWLAEVALWRQDPTRPIALWPVPWQMRLAHE